MEYAEHVKRRYGEDAVPIRTGAIIRWCEAGLLLDFTGDAARDIDRATPEIGEIGRSRWKIDAAGLRGVLAHFAQDERAIRTTQRAHAKTVEHFPVRKAPVAPRQEAREIGLEITAAKALSGEDRIARQQDAAVPHRLLALFFRKMRVDIGAPPAGEPPPPSAASPINPPPPPHPPQPTSLTQHDFPILPPSP